MKLPELQSILQAPGTYTKTLSFDREYINSNHAFYANAPTEGVKIISEIPGWLRREDALKLYELAYLSEGDILELGTSRGLSCSIMSKAMADAGRPGTIHTVDLSEKCTVAARKNLAKSGLNSRVRLYTIDGEQACIDFLKNGQKFGFAFIDHSHAYEHVLGACRHLKSLMLPGAYMLFHDFRDSRNTMRKGVGESPSEYGIYAALRDWDETEPLNYKGAFGCCGLFQFSP